MEGGNPHRRDLACEQEHRLGQSANGSRRQDYVSRGPIVEKDIIAKRKGYTYQGKCNHEARCRSRARLYVRTRGEARG